jgi:hypothetical protein
MTPRELVKAQTLYLAGASIDRISLHFQRRYGTKQIANNLRFLAGRQDDLEPTNWRKSFVSSVVTRVSPSPKAIEDMNRCRELYPETLTAWVMGDPLPGRSALDRLLANNKEVAPVLIKAFGADVQALAQAKAKAGCE